MSAVPHAREGPSLATALDPVFRQQLQERRRRLEGYVPPRAGASAPGAGAAGARQEVVRLLEEVDAALDRLDAGTFGVCDVCHDPVEPERLHTDPLCRICLDHLEPRERRALEHDLEMAGRIQAGLLPERDHLFDGWQVHTRYLPLGPVSGDYFDLVRPRTGEGVLLFGDVAGKGIAASLLMAHLQAIFRSLVGQMPAVADIVNHANRIFCNSTTGSAYATLVCGRLAQDGALELVNAGHPPALLLGERGVESVSGTGLPVGLFLGSDYGSVGRQLSRGDVLLLYTDGVSEARGVDGGLGAEPRSGVSPQGPSAGIHSRREPPDAEFGAERVAAALERSRGASAEAVVDAVLSDLAAFRRGAPLHDDVTVMAVRRVS